MENYLIDQCLKQCQRKCHLLLASLTRLHGETGFYAQALESLIARHMSGEWINELERQSLNRRNPSLLEPQLVKNVLAARDSPCINPLT